ncbi:MULTISPECIES: AtpZ/AtpI family protein [unclassified Nocardioides]|uniref:AtpZ/AtpI family protein n=1 Tax=unclassified Nocardioides TaxID=2615069 RepID=UPI0006FE4B5F|nr:MULTISPECIES: AtpZ/AtpI family protein [unclassified Nocardioides]KQY54505.1 hypothetical protein ASD30_17795 [Nocardioides sp. Root140]KQZ66380.1 hypothetical protein ASD66_22875 [Nocardioides sp. Root151]KRF19580.1 hypothetical protein ASH02_23755 [Nocardioides sp. Soil796]
MAQQKPPTAHSDKRSSNEPQGDPWHAFGYIVAGVFLYGALGWGLDRWLGTTYIVAIGILLGAGFGIYMTWARFRQPFTDHK